ncbi:hypothetical protein BDV97DRAFT_368243 [Delphinella strobiligena]|nr:hypothetical protein BDV97DRAFT_368243 [Delphinella strobiligena]
MYPAELYQSKCFGDQSKCFSNQSYCSDKCSKSFDDKMGKGWVMGALWVSGSELFCGTEGLVESKLPVFITCLDARPTSRNPKRRCCGRSGGFLSPGYDSPNVIEGEIYRYTLEYMQSVAVASFCHRHGIGTCARSCWSGRAGSGDDELLLGGNWLLVADAATIVDMEDELAETTLPMRDL